MTRLERQEAFANELEALVLKWHERLNTGEIVGILTMQGIRLTVDSTYDPVEDETRDGEEWKNVE